MCIGGENQEFSIHQQALLREYNPFDPRLLIHSAIFCLSSCIDTSVRSRR